MATRTLELSRQTQLGKIPPKWQEKYIIKRIDEEDIEITLNQRNVILRSLANRDRFIQINKYTIMLNGIKSIDPKWGEDNIPPRPKEQVIFRPKPDDPDTYIEELVNKDELDEWDSLFGGQAIQKGEDENG